MVSRHRTYRYPEPLQHPQSSPHYHSKLEHLDAISEQETAGNNTDNSTKFWMSEGKSKTFENHKSQYRSDVTNTSSGARTEVAYGGTRPKRKLEGRPAHASDAQAIMAETSNAQPRCWGVGLATNRKPFSISNRHATSVIIIIIIMANTIYIFL